MKTRLLAACLAAALASWAAAHENATGVVGERMERMEHFEELIQRVFAMLHGDQTYDAAAVRSAAAEIRDGSGSHLTALFPKGSNGPPSQASDRIWRDSRTFARYASLLESWSGVLADQAGERPRGQLPGNWEDAQMGPGMMQRGGMMGEGPASAAWHVAATCNACHARFREGD